MTFEQSIQERLDTLMTEHKVICVKFSKIDTEHGLVYETQFYWFDQTKSLQQVIGVGLDVFSSIEDVAKRMKKRCNVTPDQPQALPKQAKITIQFEMTKAEGLGLIDISSVHEDKRSSEYIRSCMKFCEDFSGVEDYIESWKILDDGLGGINIKEDYTISGHPSPIVEFILKGEIDPEDFKMGVWESSYSLEIPECNKDEPYYFEDHNGYSSVINYKKLNKRSRR